MLLYFKADKQHSMKFAFECLYQFFMVFAILSPRESECFIWNRTINNSGGHGKNISLDLNVEHSNNYIKQAVKNVRPNLTDKAVNCICYPEKGVKSLLAQIDESIERISGSEEHACCSVQQDLDRLLKRAVNHVSGIRAKWLGLVWNTLNRSMCISERRIPSIVENITFILTNNFVSWPVS